ncbi:hypothetical protein Tco_1424740 [Tanacetum coccineum]
MPNKRTLGAITKPDAPLVVVGGGCDDDDGGMGRGNGVERVVTRWWRWCRVAWQRRGGGDSGVVARGGASVGE